MKIDIFNLKMDEEKRNILVKEKSRYYQGVKNTASSSNVVKLMNDLFDLKNLAEERTYLIGMNNMFKSLGFFEISHGTPVQAYLGIREMMIRSLLVGAQKIIIIHNHPSGQVEPSLVDMKITIAIDNAARFMGIHLVDHIIIGGDNYYSFEEKRKEKKAGLPKQ